MGKLTNVELAKRLLETFDCGGHTDEERELARLAAQRLEGEISEAKIEAARKSLWDVGRIFVRSDDIRAALEAAREA